MIPEILLIPTPFPTRFLAADSLLLRHGNEFDR